MKTSVIIPNLNGKEHLERLFPSLLRQTERDFEVILVDNGSTDESISYVNSYADRLKLRVIANMTNTGFSKAVNDGIRIAEGEYVLLLNNDTVAGAHLVEQLTRALEVDVRIFSAQALMLQYDNPKLVDSAGDCFCAMGWAYSMGKGELASHYKKPREVFSCCAGAAIYRKSILEEIGYFDETFFAYLEDVDLGYRARLRGYKNVLIPKARVLHVGSATSGSKHNAFKVEASARNSVYVCKKNMTGLQLGLNAIPIGAGALIKMGYFLPKGLTKAYVKGLKDGLLHEVPKTHPVNEKRNVSQEVQMELDLLTNSVKRILPS